MNTVNYSRRQVHIRINDKTLTVIKASVTYIMSFQRPIHTALLSGKTVRIPRTAAG